jgi:pimeloyl-ACP methyl ester carboxylesterase
MINTIENIEVNGRKLYFRVRANAEKLPILLFLHGGPGFASIPLVKKYNKNLEDLFTVVVLDQRGAGKSYYPFGETEEINIETFINDVHAVVTYLLKRFNRDKLCLWCHSWGTVLGLKYIQCYPELIDAYIGCGQAVNMKKSTRAAYEFAIAGCENAGDKKAVMKLRTIDYLCGGENWFADLLYYTGKVVKYKGSLYEKTTQNAIVFDIITAREYSLKDKLNFINAQRQSLKRLWLPCMDVDFESCTAFEVPVIFIEGRQDFHVSSKLAFDYFQTITTEKQFFWFEKSAHYPQWSEPQKFFDIMKRQAEGLLKT